MSGEYIFKKKNNLSKKNTRKTKKNNKPEDIYIQNLRKKQGYMPFTSHLEELRSRLIRAIFVLGFITSICFIYYDEIWVNVMSTMADIIEKGQKENIVIDLVTTHMQDEVLIQFKVALMIGLLLACPYLIFEFWSFVTPAINQTFKKWSNVVLIFAIFLFWSGILFCYKFIWPTMAEFLLFEWTPPPIVSTNGMLIYTKKYLTIPDYISSFFNFHFAFGLTFQIPVISVLLSFMGILNSAILLNNWRICIMLIAIISAIITPADWISMVLMMAPLIGLYLISILLVFIVERKNKNA